MWGLGRKENYMEGVASLLCPCADRLDIQSGRYGEQGDFNSSQKVGFPTLASPKSNATTIDVMVMARHFHG